MNIPLGTPEKRFVELKFDSVMTDLRTFMEKKKTGYLVVLADGKYSFQEGFIAIDTGMIFAANFEYLKYGKVFKAGDALDRAFNAMRASKGLYDLYSWSTQQVELFKVFNDDLMLIQNITPVSLIQMVPKMHKDFESQDLSEFIQTGVDRTELLKKYGMAEIKNEKTVEDQIVEDLEKGVVDEHKQLEEMLNSYITSSEKDKPKMSGEDSSSDTPPVGHGVEKFKSLALKEDK